MYDDNYGSNRYGVPYKYQMLRDLALALKFKPIPPATTFLVTLCCGIHLARIILKLDTTFLAFIPHRVLFRFEVYRIFTGVLVHLDSYHLLSNMLSIVVFHAHLERSFGTLRLLEACLWATVLSKGIYLLFALERLGFRGSSSLWYTPVAGFSGVIFFMTVLDCCLFPQIDRKVEFPIIGVIRVSSTWYPWLLLLSCEVWLPRSSFIGHLSGILAGSLVATGIIDPYFASRETLQSLERSERLAFLVNKRLYVEPPPSRSRPIDRDILWRIYRGFEQILLPLVRLVVNLICGLTRLLLGMGGENIMLWRGTGYRLDDDTTDQEPVDPEPERSSSSRVDSVPEDASETAGSGEADVSKEGSAVVIGESQVPQKGSVADSDEGNTEISSGVEGVPTAHYCDDSSGSAEGVPESFSKALNVLTTANDDYIVVSKTLKTLITLINNATDKGQKDPKYRKIRVSNPRIQECNIPGALDILKAVGFEVKEDFYDETFLAYPRQEPPNWLVCALEMMQATVDDFTSQAKRPHLDGDKDNYRRLAADAALRRQLIAKKKKTVSKKASDGYSAGMGGGNSERYFYLGGT